jgi:F0F1-type ATP synthase assembly protein I
MKKFFKINTEGKIEEAEITEFRKKKESSWRYLDYLGIGYSLVTPVVVGALVGVWLDKVIFFIFLGMFFSFYNLYKIIKG